MEYFILLTAWKYWGKKVPDTNGIITGTGGGYDQSNGIPANCF